MPSSLMAHDRIVGLEVRQVVGHHKVVMVRERGRDDMVRALVERKIEVEMPWPESCSRDKSWSRRHGQGAR
jgi:hypothetical protein